MKKLLILSVAVSVFMLSCSNKEDNDIKFSLSKRSYTLYHSQTENIQGENVNNLDWASDNEFVATVSDGVIEGQFVGKTTVHESSHKLSFEVEVKPKYNLYTEPAIDWGASMAEIRNRYGTPALSEPQALVYESGNSNVPLYMYMFEDGKLKSSCAVAKLSAGPELIDFLAERYLPVNVNANAGSATFLHCYGRISDPQTDYGVGFSYSSSVGGLLIIYLPTSSDDTRANADVRQEIERLLAAKEIKVE